MDLAELRKEIDALDQELVHLFCQRMTVSAKIAEYKKEKGLEIKAEIENLPFTYMDSVDFSALLNNILDNAIRGAVASKERKIEVQIYQQNGMDIVTVKNSIDESVLDKNPTLVSTKKEAGHGYGMKQIKGIVEKYDGMMDVYEKKQMFVVSVMLNDLM